MFSVEHASSMGSAVMEEGRSNRLFRFKLWNIHRYWLVTINIVHIYTYIEMSAASELATVEKVLPPVIPVFMAVLST